MTSSISRRALLKTGLLTTASLPFAGWLNGAGHQKDRQIDSNEPILVKLNANENPYGPSPRAREAIIEAISKGNRYPWSMIEKLKKKIAAHEGVSAKHILITAGSTELLGLAGLVYSDNAGKFISCVPTFDFAMRYARDRGAKWEQVPLTPGYQYDLKGIGEKISDDTNLVFVCNPNNPTGVEIPNDSLRSFCRQYGDRVPLYIDEAYIELTEMGISGSMVDMVDDFPKMVIARTFSKIYGMAGLRIGYALAHPDTIKVLRAFHTGNGMTPSVCSLAGAMASLEDQEFTMMSKKLNKKAREMCYAKFSEWGIEALPSATSFILFRTDKFNVDIRKELQRKNILIRTYGHVPGWARVSMGTLEEMDIFLNATGRYVS
jgi:histidinol-phosphate aminotransferase